MDQKQAMPRLSKQKQGGFLLAQMAVFVMILSITIAYAGHEYWTKTVNEGRDNRARLVGSTLAKITDATKTYTTTYYQPIQQGQAITGNGYTVPAARVLTPTLADLNGLGFLPNWAVPAVVYNGQSISYTVKITVDTSTGCAVPACNLPFQVTTTSALLDPVNTANVDIRRATIAAQTASPGNAGVAMPASFGGNPAVFVTSNGTQIGTNPGSVAGLISMSNNYDSQGFAAFLRRDGTLPMTGDFNLQDTTGAKHNINNANTVNAQKVVVPAGNNVQVGNAAFYGDGVNAAVRSAPGGGVYAQDVNGNYVTFNSGSVQANGNIWASGAINSASPGGYGPTYLQSYGLNGASSIYIEPASGQNLYLTTSGWNNTGTLLSYFGSNYFQNRLTANEYFQVNGQANVGWGCSPNGLEGRDSSGGPLYCKNGVWTAPGGVGPFLVGGSGTCDYSTAVAACPAGAKLLSGGYVLTWYNGSNFSHAPDASYPDSANNRWLVNGSGYNQCFQSYANCTY
ncbi:hypothetical protein [Ralstonia insidiosa]|uniref:Shufflon system plasmid conjugative transfer pilus tip adhesin PilV n=1 Tax=Ralstonia insidiosa TaxID=190721 RepID=A0A848NX61_9RALS|nr:hypothetical protein [Ralstonia insidiosa]NMV39901.1 hypothetical protein [Ralstonia insidiosa]